MRRSWIAFLAVVALVAFAAPAMADVNLNGFVRIKGYMANHAAAGNGYTLPVAKSATESTYTYVDERARLKFTVGDENVKAVAFFELDQQFGDSAYTNGRNTGGGLEADTNNLETKNIYIWFKVPNTSVDVTAGVLNASDTYAWTFFGGTDFAGVVANAKIEPVALRLAWAKFWEGAEAKADDVDLYLVEAKLAPAKDMKVGLNVYYINDLGSRGPSSSGAAVANTIGSGTSPLGGRGGVIWTPNEFASGFTSLKVWMPGVDFSMGAGPATISAFAFYQGGTAKNVGFTVGNDVKVKGYAADVRADLNLGAGKGFVELLFVSGDSNKTDKDYKGIVTASNYNLAGSFYSRTDMFILFPNIDDINRSSALAYDVANGGAGVFHVGAGYSQKLGDKLGVKVGAGYLAAAKKRGTAGSTGRDTGGTYNFAQETAMGTEINANVTYNIAKGLDFGLAGAYAFLGSAYELTSTGGTPAAGASGEKARNPWLTFARLNYAF